MTESYHEVFIPFTDVYELGGPEVFSQLERRKDGKNLVVVPMQFVEALDTLKEKENSLGAEDVLKYLKNATKSQVRSSEDGVSICAALEGLEIALMETRELAGDRFSINALESKVRELWIPDGNKKPVLITNSERYHIKFGSRGMIVQDPLFLQVNEDIVHEGIIMGNDELYCELLQREGSISLEEAGWFLDRELYQNQFIRFVGGDRDQYARVTGHLLQNKSGSRVVGVDEPTVRLLNQHEYGRSLQVGKQPMSSILGILPRDMEQYLALQYGVLKPTVSLFFLCGSQGSGKTLLAYLGGVDLTLWYDKEVRERRGLKDNGKGGFFDRMVVLKPNEIVGGARRDIGFLPGSMYEKLKPHLGGYIDAHRESDLYGILPFDAMLLHPKFTNDFGEPRSPEINQAKINGCAHLPPNTEVIEMTYTGYMRGRSFRRTLVIVDESQNLTPYEMKTVLERLGEGCKCIVLGDPAQRDNPKCSNKINGLTHAIRNYLARDYTALVHLTRNYRHQISEDTKDWRVYSR